MVHGALARTFGPARQRRAAKGTRRAAYVCAWRRRSAIGHSINLTTCIPRPQPGDACQPNLMGHQTWMTCISRHGSTKPRDACHPESVGCQHPLNLTTCIPRPQPGDACQPNLMGHQTWMTCISRHGSTKPRDACHPNSVGCQCWCWGGSSRTCASQ
jgi:hypothetical protein